MGLIVPLTVVLSLLLVSLLALNIVWYAVKWHFDCRKKEQESYSADIKSMSDRLDLLAADVNERLDKITQIVSLLKMGK